MDVGMEYGDFVGSGGKVTCDCGFDFVWDGMGGFLVMGWMYEDVFTGFGDCFGVFFFFFQLGLLVSWVVILMVGLSRTGERESMGGLDQR